MSKATNNSLPNSLLNTSKVSLFLTNSKVIVHTYSGDLNTGLSVIQMVTMFCISLTIRVRGLFSWPEVRART